MKNSKSLKHSIYKCAIAFILAFVLILSVYWAATRPMTASATSEVTYAEKDPGYSSEFTDRTSVRLAAEEVSIQTMREGAVLLKNENNALPFTESQPKVTLFGKFSENITYSGTGSAAFSGLSNVRTFHNSLEKAGFVLNPQTKALYADNARSGRGRPNAYATTNVYTAGYPVGEMRATGAVDYGGTAWNRSEPTPEDLNYDPANTTPGYSNYQSVRSSYADYNDAAIIVVSRMGGEGYDLPRSMRMANSGGTSDYPAGSGLGRLQQEVSYTGTTIIPGARSKTDHYLQLDLNETNMIKEAAHYFDKIVLLINSPTQMELGFLDDPTHYAYSPKIEAALWCSFPGNVGAEGIADLLIGKTIAGNEEFSPSGGLASTWYRNFKDDPVWFNYGLNDAWQDNTYRIGTGDSAVLSNPLIRFVDYQEDIYMDYRYYETRYAETLKAQGKAAADTWYKNNVVYPFGFGMSYTDFDWEVVGSRLDGSTFSSNDSLTSVKGTSTFEFDVKVTNTGERAGKDAVQIYVQAPYENGKIDKPHKVLAGFNKTRLLQPGQSQTITVEVDAYYFASYDWADKNTNSFKGYELDAGEYIFHISTDSHNAKAEVKANLNAVKIENDPVSGAKVSNLYDVESEYMRDNSAILSRANNFANYTNLSLGCTRRDGKTADFIAKFGRVTNWATSTGNRFVDNIGDVFAEVGITDDMLITEPFPTLPTTALTYEASTIKFADMRNVPFDDPLWDDFMKQVTLYQMSTTVSTGGFFTFPGVENVGLPGIIQMDGSLGLAGSQSGSGYAASGNQWTRMISVVASTFNADLIYKLGQMVGEEALWGYNIDGTPISGLLGPGADTHRSPFSGRNFEYQSADSFLGGKTLAAFCKGLQDKGVIAHMKHFFLNDQETDRDINSLATWATEQTMREIYARQFEIAIKDTITHARERGRHPLMGTMSAFNRIGYTWVGGDYRSMNLLMRGEWGFVGTTVTDNSAFGFMHAERAVLAEGSDAQVGNKRLDTSDAAVNHTKYGNHYKWSIYKAFKYYVFNAVNSNAYNSAFNIRGTGAVLSNVGEGFSTTNAGGSFNVNLTTADNTAANVAQNWTVGTPVNFNLYSGIAAARRPQVYYGDRSAVTYTYSLASGYSLPAGLQLLSNGTIVGTPTAPTVNASGTSATNVVRVYISAPGYFRGTQDVTLRVNMPSGTSIPSGITYNGNFLGTVAHGASVNISVGTASTISLSNTQLVYSLKNSVLPNGLSLLPNGTIAGILQAYDTYTAVFTVQVTALSTATATLNDVVATAEALFTLQVGAAYNDSAVRTLISDLQRQVDEIKESIGEMQGDISAIQNQIAGINGSITALEASVTALDTKTDGEITKLKADLAALDTALKALETKHDNLEEKVDAKVEGGGCNSSISIVSGLFCGMLLAIGAGIVLMLRRRTKKNES